MSICWSVCQKYGLAAFVCIAGLMLAHAAGAVPITVSPSLNPGPPVQLSLTVQSPSEGLVEIAVTQSENATTFVPPFFVGTIDPVVITSFLINQALDGVVSFQVTTASSFVGQFSYTFNASGFVDNLAEVPEPGTLLLLGVGLAGLGLIRQARA